MNSLKYLVLLLGFCFSACARDGAGHSFDQVYGNDESTVNSIKSAASVCGLDAGNYQGTYEAVENYGEEGGSRLVLQLFAGDVTVALGGVGVVIFAKANSSHCVENSLVFNFEDNWGTTGMADVKLISGGNLQVSFSDLGTDGQNYSRNVLSYYPEMPVVLGRMATKETLTR